MPGKSSSSSKGGSRDDGRYRSSETGRYVKDSYGERNPRTTEYEKSKPSGGGSGGSKKK